jgi:rRNA maturation RNase YbeY
MAVLLHHTYDQYPTPDDQNLIPFLNWILQNERYVPGDINIIFTDNPEIIHLNRQYLNHDYYTDVITFYYNDSDQLNGDVYISLDKVRENAGEYGTSYDDELLRVVFHGLLHLCGYSDNQEDARKEMREKENFYLNTYYSTRK